MLIPQVYIFYLFNLLLYLFHMLIFFNFSEYEYRRVLDFNNCREHY